MSSFVKTHSRQTDSFRLLLFSAFLFSVWSCSSYKAQQAKIEKLVQNSEFVEAADKHRDSFDIYPSQDELLFYLNQSLLDYYSSIQQRLDDGPEWYLNGPRSGAFERTEDMLRLNDRQQTSFKDQAKSTALKTYSATLQESLWQNAFASLYYWNRQSLDGALVELRRSHEKAKIYQQYSQISEEQHRKRKDAQLDFRDSALMQYLAMVYYREDQRLDDWRISREDLETISSNRSYYPKPVPEDYLPVRRLDKNSGAVNFCIFTGSGVRKYAQGTRIIKVPGGIAIQMNDGSDPESELGFQTVLIPSLSSNFSFYEMQIPVMRKQSNLVRRIEVLVDGELRQQLYPLEPFAQINMEVFRRLRADFLPRQITAFILKVVASEVTQGLLSQADESIGFVAGLIGSALVKISSPEPDLRVARFSPSMAWVGELQLAAGQHLVEMLYYSDSGLLHRSAQPVAVQPGKSEIVQDYYAR